jgi:hypothetical protein
MNSSRAMWDIAHEWANDWDGKGIGAAANILYGNGCIYSYGDHFMIARHVQNDKGERAVLFTGRTYSQTTAKHIKAVENASSHLTKIYVADPALGKEELFDNWVSSFCRYRKSLTMPKNMRTSLATPYPPP